MNIVQKMVWWLYCTFVIGVVGYFSFLLGTFATDAPSTTLLGGMIVGSLIFVAGIVLFIGVPIVFWKWIKKQNDNKKR